jgi:DNA replication protein DnaC
MESPANIYRKEVALPSLLDRLLHHARIVPIAGESYRLKHQRQAGMVQVKKAVNT